MKTTHFIVVAAMLSAPLVAQEAKPVPKDSVRVFIPGCSKGLIFTVGPRTEDRAGAPTVPEGMHVRMSGPKGILTEIKAQEGRMIEVTGLMKKGQYGQDGVKVGGVRISPGTAGANGLPSAGAGQTMIDVESWRRIPGECPSRK